MASGAPRHPASLARYAYADSRPTMAVDPTGWFTTSDLGQAQAVQGNIINSASNLGTYNIARVSVDTLVSLTTTTLVDATLWRRIKDWTDAGRRKTGLSVFLPAGDTPMTTSHIAENIVSRPENARLTKFSARPDNRQWYRNRAECSGAGECDEYPFFTTFEGGAENYPARVTLQLVPFGESAVQGGKLSAFYRACGLPDGARFSVAPAPTSSESIWICGDTL